MTRVELAPNGFPYVYDRSEQFPVPIDNRDPQMQCPGDGCGVPLQASVKTGELVTGVAQHLQVVHQVVGVKAATMLARESVRQHVAKIRRRI